MPFDFACPDWWAKLQAGETPIADLPLNDELADIAVELFDKLVVPDIPGQPTMGEAAGDWIRDIARAAFGSIDPVTKARRVGEIFTLVPKKNAKTTNAAALGLVALQMNTTPNIEGVIIGPTQAVADKCFAQAAAMIEADEWLKKRFKVIEHRKTIEDIYPDPETGRPLKAKLVVKSFDPKVLTGIIPAFAIVDELHVMAAAAYAHRVIGQIRGGMITNPQSLLIFITTQSEDAPRGVFKAELEYARKVRDGLITDGVRMLPVLYEFPEAVQLDKAEPWRNPAIWAAVLPNIGRSITVERLVQDYKKAVEDGPTELERWASQHLNIQVGMGSHRSQWVGGSQWPGAAEPGLTLEDILEVSDVCTIGIDGGGLDDLLGLSVVGRDRETRVYRAWFAGWVHKVGLERRKGIASQLEDLAREDAFTICEAPHQDIDELVEIVARVHEAGLLPDTAAIGLDPEGVAAIVDALTLAGIPSDMLAAVTQGYKLNGAIKGAERKLLNGTLLHGAQPLAGWCVDNAKTEPRGNAVIVTKAVSGAGKIDPLMAFFNAFHLMSRNPEPPRQDLTGFLNNPVMVA